MTTDRKHEDAGVGNEDRNYELARRRLAELAPPAELPRELIWRTVAADWRARAERRRRIRTVTRWAGAGVGLAAALVLGVLIGRSSGPAAVAPAQPEGTQAATTLPVPYRIAVGEHLRDAEMLLVSFDTSGKVDADVVRSARELAAASRLLIDSRAGEDPEARRLLLDVELLLLQISRLMEGGDQTERQLIREGLEESSVLPRLQQGDWLQGV
ncbi:MAG TPA: hypothetical protein VFX89_10180 [Gammaproteobacteria bacterium]|nr:hypothetical protein [Gammaproteobacteria bacterium]